MTLVDLKCKDIISGLEHDNFALIIGLPAVALDLPKHF